MAITVKAAAPFSWFGQSYLEGDTVDTAGYDGNSMRRLLRLAPVYVESAASGPSQGTTIGVASVVDVDTVGITFTSVWGIDVNGPYYDPSGAASGDAAILTVDPTTGEWLVVKPEGAVAV